MSEIDNIAKQLADVIREKDKKVPEPYDTTAVVTRVDSDGTAWVHIAGGVDETPVKKTISCQTGDSVQVRVSGGRAWITGNASAPPTDDATANVAKTTAAQAQGAAIEAQETATEAINQAIGAAEAAASARRSAQEASTAATEATEAAGVANLAANNALTQLGTVEEVVGTLNWIAEHATYYPTKDSEPIDGKMYFSITGTAVSSPVDSGLSSYYELVSGKYYLTADTTVDATKTYYTVAASLVSVAESDDPATLGYYEISSIDDAVSNYIQTHLTLTDEGLFILMDSNGYKLKLTNDGAYIVDPSGATVATYSTEAVIGNLNGYNYLRLSRSGMRLTTDGGQTAAFEVSLYNGDPSSESTSFTHQFVIYNGADIIALDPRITDGDITLTLTMYNSLDPGSSYTATKTFTPGTASQQTVFEYTDPARGEQRFLLQYDGRYYISLVCQYNYDSFAITINGTANYNIQANRRTYYTLGQRASDPSKGAYSVAEGLNVTASGSYSHSEGGSTTASGRGSHAEGIGTTASGECSHSQNYHTITDYDNQTVIGKYNENQSNTAIEIGNGTSSAASNALTVDWSGNVELALDTTAASGTVDGDLYDAITVLGWESEVIV